MRFTLECDVAGACSAMPAVGPTAIAPNTALLLAGMEAIKSQALGAPRAMRV